MRITDFTSLTLESTKGNLLRTFLSIISVVIGVFSFVFVVSLNEGMADQVLSRVEKRGGFNVFLIYCSKINMKRVKNKNLINGPYRRVAKFPISPGLVARLNSAIPSATFYTISKPKERRISINGELYGISAVDEKYFNNNEFLLQLDGRGISELDVISKNNVIVVGSKIKNQYHTNKSVVGNSLRLNNYKFEIIGQYKEKNIIGENKVFIPTSTADQVFKPTFSEIYVKVKDINDLKRVRAKVKSYLNLCFGKDMFSVQDKEKEVEEHLDMANSYGDLILLFSFLMLVTGGIGIMNIMLASIKERLREIGIKKAVGATNKDIFTQFLLETLSLFIIGGFIGIVTAVLSVEEAAHLIIKEHAWLKAKTLVSPNVILISILFTGITGIIFGLLPAFKASRIVPIESLRYE